MGVTVGQQGPSTIALSARCLAGGHEALCWQQLQRFREQLDAAVEQQWPGCAPSVTETSSEGVTAEEGVPPEETGRKPEQKPDWEPEPEPEPKPEPPAEPYPEPELEPVQASPARRQDIVDVLEQPRGTRAL